MAEPGPGHSSDEEPEMTEGYVPPAKVSAEEMMKKDADDESLRKYKESLLKTTKVETDEKRNVVIKELALVSGDNVVAYVLDTPESVEKMTATPLQVKEGVDYQLRVAFNVNHDIVMGLKYFHTVKKAGIRVEKKTSMMGSFGPQEDSHVIKMEVDSAPSGMLGRGKYSVKSKFCDDDGETHLEWSWTLVIAKNWA